MRAKETEHTGSEMESSLEGEEEGIHCSSSVTSDGAWAGMLTKYPPEKSGWV